MANAKSFEFRTVVVDRGVYATITVVSVLVVYDGWQHLKFIDVVGVIVGPIVAMFLSHVFAANLAQQVALGRPPTRAERIDNVRSESRFLLLAVPPLALLVATSLAGLSLEGSIRVIVWAGGISLGAWSGLAGRRAGLTRWAFARSVLAGLILGAIILILQVLLQPGKAVTNGVALGVVGRLLQI